MLQDCDISWTIGEEDNQISFVPGVDIHCDTNHIMRASPRNIKKRKSRSLSDKNQHIDHRKSDHAVEMEQVSISKHGKTVSLKDLCPEDKARVANLIQELAKIGEEKDRVDGQLNEERELFNKQLHELQNDKEKMKKEKELIFDKYQKCQELLTVYQEKISEQQNIASEEINKLLNRSLSSKSGECMDENMPPQSPLINAVRNKSGGGNTSADTSANRDNWSSPLRAMQLDSPHHHHHVLDFHPPRDSHHANFERQLTLLTSDERRAALREQKQALEQEQAALQQLLKEQERLMKKRREELMQRQAAYAELVTSRTSGAGAVVRSTPTPPRNRQPNTSTIRPHVAPVFHMKYNPSANDDEYDFDDGRDDDDVIDVRSNASVTGDDSTSYLPVRTCIDSTQGDATSTAGVHSSTTTSMFNPTSLRWNSDINGSISRRQDSSILCDSTNTLSRQDSTLHCDEDSSILPRQHSSIFPLRDSSLLSRPDSSSFAPHQDSSSFAPRQDSSSFAPRQDSSSFAPRQDSSSFAPHQDSSSFAPHQDSSSFAPHQDSSSFAPRQDSSTFAPRQDSSSFAPRQASSILPFQDSSISRQDSSILPPAFYDVSILPSRTDGVEDCGEDAARSPNSSLVESHGSRSSRRRLGRHQLAATSSGQSSARYVGRRNNDEDSSTCHQVSMNNLSEIGDLVDAFELPHHDNNWPQSSAATFISDAGARRGAASISDDPDDSQLLEDIFFIK